MSPGRRRLPGVGPDDDRRCHRTARPPSRRHVHTPAPSARSRHHRRSSIPNAPLASTAAHSFPIAPPPTRLRSTPVCRRLAPDRRTLDLDPCALGSRKPLLVTSPVPTFVATSMMARNASAAVSDIPPRSPMSSKWSRRSACTIAACRRAQRQESPSFPACSARRRRPSAGTECRAGLGIDQSTDGLPGASQVRTRSDPRPRGPAVAAAVDAA
jgi:hypothetical protein